MLCTVQGAIRNSLFIFEPLHNLYFAISNLVMECMVNYFHSAMLSSEEVQKRENTFV